MDSPCRVAGTSSWAGVFKGQKKGWFLWESLFLDFLPLFSTSQHLSVGFQRKSNFWTSTFDANTAWVVVVENSCYSVRILKPSMSRHTCKTSKPQDFEFLYVIICANCSRSCSSWLLVLIEFGQEDHCGNIEKLLPYFRVTRAFDEPSWTPWLIACFLPQVWDVVLLSHGAGLDLC